MTKLIHITVLGRMINIFLDVDLDDEEDDPIIEPK